MKSLSSSRALAAFGAALIALLAMLAVLQYRWSTRVAAADAQREREHLESSAALFDDRFNGMVSSAFGFMSEEAWAAQSSHAKLTGVPKIISELYFLDFSDREKPKAQRLTPDGEFAASAAPEWLKFPGCAPVVTSEPLALMAPIHESTNIGSERGKAVNITRPSSDKCFVARLSEDYLRNEVIPGLLRDSFGESSASNYDFAVAPHGRPGIVYGTAVTPDVKKQFFSVSRLHLVSPRALATSQTSHQRNTFVFMQNITSSRIEVHAPGAAASIADLFGDGIWDLEVAHKGLPLDEWFERIRRRNLLMSVAVESLVAVAAIFMLIAVRRAQSLAEQKMRFVAAVSHELRTPVSAISMLSRNQADGLVNGERVKQYGELIHHEVRRLSDVVEQTLQYAGIHSGLHRSAKPVDLARLVTDAVGERRAELSRQGFEIETAIASDLPQVEGDARLLRIAIDNLLGNAEKYAVAGGWIRVSAAYSASAKEVLITVEDHGPGIEAADRAEIFEPFYRGQAALKTQVPGSGLGLSLVRGAAEAHRGTVTLESEPGHGSSFTLHLPV